jgi:hypothetical protein
MQILSSSQTLLKTLTNGDTFSLESIEGWQELDTFQQSYINAYVDTVMQPTLARAKTGVSRSIVDSWESDQTYGMVMQQIEDIFTEGLSSIHFQDAVGNAKIRPGVLRARKAKGYEEKSTTQHNHLHLNAASPQDLLRALTGKTD